MCKKGIGLPNGFSYKYDESIPARLINCWVRTGTPFDKYLVEICNGKRFLDQVDSLYDNSGVSDWLFLDESVEINTAARSISDWADRHRETNRLQHTALCCTGNVMVVIDDKRQFEDITDESIQICKAAKVSFCIILSDREMFDLIEQKAKEVHYVKHMNSHDEIYCNWSFSIDPERYAWVVDYE